MRKGVQLRQNSRDHVAALTFSHSGCTLSHMPSLLYLHARGKCGGGLDSGNEPTTGTRQQKQGWQQCGETKHALEALRGRQLLVLQDGVRNGAHRLPGRDLHGVLHTAFQHLHAICHAPCIDVQLTELKGGQPLTVPVLHGALERLDGIVHLAQDPAANSVNRALPILITTRPPHLQLAPTATNMRASRGRSRAACLK